jgi:hypothetical protein
MSTPRICPRCNNYLFDDEAPKCVCRRNLAPEPARPSEGSVTCSDWLGELEAALRIAKLADERLAQGKLDLCKWNIGQIQERLTQIIEAERGRSPSE